MQSSSQKINQKTKLLKVLSFFQTLRNFEGTFTVLGEKVFGRDIKIDKCSFRRRRSIKKSKFWKFSFFSNSSEPWTNIYRAWRKTFRQGYQNWKLQSSSQKINQKTKLLEVLFFSKFFRNLNEHLPCLAKKFSAGISKLKIAVVMSQDLSKIKTFESSLFQILRNFERTFPVLGEKVFGRVIKLENCTICVQSIILGLKKVLESFVSFHLFRTWNIIVLDLRQQSFHPVCQKCYPRVYMNSLRDVGITRDISWRETFFEPWRKNSDLFLKTAFYVSKGKFWVKNTFFKSYFFFKLFRTLNEHLLCLARKFSERDIKIEKCSFRLIRPIKKSNFWKFSFFSNSSEHRTNNNRARRKSFRQGYQNWKLQFSSHKVNQKINFLEILFYQILQNFERIFTVLGEKLFSRVIKIKNCSLRLKRSIKKPNIWKFSFFSNSSELWTNIYCVWRESFRQGYQNRKMHFSSHKIYQKTKLLEVLFFSKFFRNLNEHLPCLAKKFSAGISKLKIAVVMSQDLSKIKTFESSLFQILRNFERTFPVLGEKVFGRVIKLESCTICVQSIILRLKISFRKFCKFSFISDLEHNCFRLEATEFSPSLSKMLSACLYEFSSRCWYYKRHKLKRNFFWTLAEKFRPVS